MFLDGKIMSVFCKLIDKLNAPIKIPVDFFEVCKMIMIFMQIQNKQNNLENEQRLPISRLIKARVFKTALIHKYVRKHQWNRIRSLEIDHTHMV